MTELGQLPHVRALLVELLQLGGEDALLPIPVLVNLHREQLRAPLRNLFAVANPGYVLTELYSSPLRKAEHALLVRYFLETHYPQLLGGKLYAQDPQLQQLVGGNQYLSAVSLASRTLDVVEQAFFQRTLFSSQANFSALDPLLLLKALTFPQAHTGVFLLQLEAELQVDPVVPQLILDMAAQKD